jgi:hypothetical protein
MMAASHLKDTDLLVDKCFVGGQWIGVPSEEVLNPATKEVMRLRPGWWVSILGLSLPQKSHSEVSRKVRSGVRALVAGSKSTPNSNMSCLLD